MTFPCLGKGPSDSVSRMGFHSSCCVREAPVSRSWALFSLRSSLTSHHLFLADRSPPPPALKLTYFSSVTREGLAPEPSVGPPLTAPPALGPLQAALSACHPVDARTSSHVALSSLPEGPRSAGNPCCFAVRVWEATPSSVHLLSRHSVCLASPFPSISFSLTSLPFLFSILFFPLFLLPPLPPLLFPCSGIINP